jgi:hypothetical protein
MKTRLSFLFALAALAVGALPAAPAAAVTSCPPGVTDLSYCEISNTPGAHVSFVDGMRIIKTPSGLVVVTGWKVRCQPGKRTNCGGSTVVTAQLGNASRVVTIGRLAWHVRTGHTKMIRVPVRRKYVKRIERLRKIRLVVKIRSHARGALTHKKTATIKLR